MLDKLYYVILSYYYSKTEHKKDTPVITVFFIFSLVLCCFILLVITMLNVLKNPESRNLGISKTDGYLILSICCGIIYFFFIRNKRYLKIYSRYRSDVFLNSKCGRLVYWCMLVFLILSPFIFMVLRNRLVFGHWI